MFKTEFDREAAIAAHKQKKIVKSQYSHPDWGLDLTLEELALISATYPSAQQYGPKFEKWINTYCGWEKINSKLGEGDSKIVSVNGQILRAEQKWGIRTDVGPGGLQHRLWQPIDYYLYGHVDDSVSENITVDIYLLSKEQVIAESKILKVSATHGTKDANILNENIEYSMGVGYGSSDHQRWKDKYKVTLGDLKKL